MRRYNPFLRRSKRNGTRPNPVLCVNEWERFRDAWNAAFDGTSPYRRLTLEERTDLARKRREALTIGDLGYLHYLHRYSHDSKARPLK